MYDSNGYKIEAILGRRDKGKFYVVQYVRKSLNEAEKNYITTKKELQTIVFELGKLWAYFLGTSIGIFTHHSTLK